MRLSGKCSCFGEWVVIVVVGGFPGFRFFLGKCGCSWFFVVDRFEIAWVNWLLVVDGGW